MTAQLSAGSLFNGFASSAIFTIGTQTGFTPALLAALGGGLAEVAVRITLFDGDSAPGTFDHNNNWLLLDGINIGSFTRPSERTDSNGTFISSGTGFGDGTLDTAWWYITSPAALTSIYAALSDGAIDFQLQDSDFGDNFYDFTQGVSGGLVNVGAPPNIAPIVSGPVASTVNEDDAAYSIDLLAGDSDPLTITGLTLVGLGDASGITVGATSLAVDPNAYDHLALGDSEVITYSYTIEDGKGGSVAQTATITITGVNDAPTVTAAITSTATEDAVAYSVNLLAGAADDDDGAVLNVTGLTVVGDTAGITVNGNSLDINPNAYNALAAGESEVITYNYDVTDENGAKAAQTATVTINGVNDGPTANDDTLVGSSGGRLGQRVGYYDMFFGQGQPSQVASIIAAGHTPVLITSLSDAELADIDILVVQNPDNFGYGAEYLARVTAINAAVAGGLKLIIHDRHVNNAESILPGSAGFTITGSLYGSEVNFINDGHSVVSGPGGSLNDASLDGGNWSSHGFAIAGTLPASADLILSTGDASHIVTFSYGHGAGHVVYSSIPIDHYLHYLHVGQDLGSGIFDNAASATGGLDYAKHHQDDYFL